MEKWTTQGKPLEKWSSQLNLHLDLNTDAMKRVETLFQKCQSIPVGGRGQRIDASRPHLKYPLMKEKDILELISLYLVQKQLKICEYDDMKMLRELFAKPQSCPELSCDKNLVLRKTNSQSNVSLSEENLFILEEQYNYIDFLRTLDEKECFAIVQHIPVNEVKNIEALITSFGEIVYFRDSLSINTSEKIVLVKMKTASECNWVVSCLDGHAWGDKVLAATSVHDIFDGKLCCSEPMSELEDRDGSIDSSLEQFEDPISSKEVSLELSPVYSRSDPTFCHEVETEASVPQYLDLPSSPMSS